jgi:hypothetical protein
MRDHPAVGLREPDGEDAFLFEFGGELSGAPRVEGDFSDVVACGEVADDGGRSGTNVDVPASCTTTSCRCLWRDVAGRFDDGRRRRLVKT